MTKGLNNSGKATMGRTDSYGASINAPLNILLYSHCLLKKYKKIILLMFYKKLRLVNTYNIKLITFAKKK